jgi:hypothetical protein
MGTLTKEIIIDKIEILADEQLQVRERTVIKEDGKELSSSFHRWVLAPGDDLTNQDPRVQAVANALWTPAALAAYQAAVAAAQTQADTPVQG